MSERTAEEKEVSDHGEMRCGTVRWYHVSRGYGFIRPDDDGPDVFVHFSAIDTDDFKALEEKQRVAFLLAHGPRGPQAARVRVLKSGRASHHD